MKRSLAVLVVLIGLGQAVWAQDLARQFVKPPAASQPWVYWFWLNSNLTREGITADLEAMQRVGIGGVLIMEVDQGAPVGPVAFMGARWRELFKHACSEAARLGLEINMNDDAGWNGSGGPWITPELSMQKVIWSETTVEGPAHFTDRLPQPKANHNFYREIAVLAFPASGDFRIPNIQAKAEYSRAYIPPDATAEEPPPGSVIPRARLIELTAQMDKDGRLTWDAPAGRWTILRFGNTTTGIENAPAPASGRGLECDKLSPEGIEAQFAGMMAKLIADAGPAAGRTLVATHIDSWENGTQNWTPRMRAEFQKRRGYDPLPFLPVLTGRVMDGRELSERFLWDWRQTISDLLVENYAGRMEQLAQQHGLRLSIEAYDGPCDDMTYAGRADEPMCEFWINGGAFQTCKEMASAAHTYGHRILGAESFTADDHERWLQHPATIKALGDRAFCEGVNRFVFHRYAMQPWLQYRPGMTMGPWGLHYERTETWWEMSPAWHRYLARCQHLLRQGHFVADICYLQPEAAPQGFQSHLRHGYDFDNCTPEVVLNRMSARDGRLVLPDGMSYRVLALPEVRTMTPPLLRKIKALVDAGATVVGPKPVRSPSLSDYPRCDDEVKQLAAELWDRGRIIADKSPEQILTARNVAADFTSDSPLRWIHRREGDTDIYFVANGNSHSVESACTFRVTGNPPEFWEPETGRIELASSYESVDTGTRVPIRLEPSGSVFVVFRPGARQVDAVARLTRNGEPILPAPLRAPKFVIDKAVYGVLDDPARTRDVRAKVQALVDAGDFSFPVARLAQGDDPAYLVVKTLVVDYTVEGKSYETRGQDPETISLAAFAAPARAAELHCGPAGRISVEFAEPGHYELTTAAGRTWRRDIGPLPSSRALDGPWQVRFAPHWGAPDEITLDSLVPWNQHHDPGAKFFSGVATYRKKFKLAGPPAAVGGGKVYLDLGAVQVMARVKLNGHDLGVLWKPPYRVDITPAAKRGVNRLEIEVANLWPNRMIGDEQLPEDSDRNPNGTLKEWPAWVLAGKPSPTGRYTFTSWRLWKKSDAPLDSGLLGPVRLEWTQTVEMN